MARLQTGGPISLGNIANEFGMGLANVSLASYYKVGVGAYKGPFPGKVKTIAANANVPTSGQIKLSDFHGAAYYYLQVRFELTSESVFRGNVLKNGSIKVNVWGATNTYKVTVTGKPPFFLLANGAQATFNTLSSGTYTINVSDNTLDTAGYNFTAIIDLGTAASRVNGYSLLAVHAIA